MDGLHVYTNRLSLIKIKTTFIRSRKKLLMFKLKLEECFRLFFRLSFFSIGYGGTFLVRFQQITAYF